MTYIGSSPASVRYGTSGTELLTAPSPWTGNSLGQFVEPFLDQVNLGLISGPTLTVNKPTKDAANPILAPTGTSTETWDYQKAFASVYRRDGSWEAFYAARNSPTLKGNPAYMTSGDGLTWTKPNLGLITYNGSTSNNLLFVGGFTCGKYFPEIGKWVILTETDTSGAATTCIWSSDTPTSGWTLLNTVGVIAGAQPKEILRLPDGRWLLYMVTGYSNDQRRIFAGISASTDLASTFSSVGTLIPYESTTRQPYGIRVSDRGDHHYGIVLTYNVTAQTMTHDLYFSRDRLRWSLVSTGWVPLGATSAWDDSLTWNGGDIVEVGNTWYVYYCGAKVLHDATPPKDARIGRVSIGKGRVGQASGTGSITTVSLRPTSGQRLSLNCDASGGGKIEIEVLDSSGAVISGYSQAAATDITTNTYAIEPSWTGGLTLPTGSTIKLRFNLTSATLYGYSIS